MFDWVRRIFRIELPESRSGRIIEVPEEVFYALLAELAKSHPGIGMRKLGLTLLFVGGASWVAWSYWGEVLITPFIWLWLGFTGLMFFLFSFDLERTHRKLLRMIIEERQSLSVASEASSTETEGSQVN